MKDVFNELADVMAQLPPWLQPHAPFLQRILATACESVSDALNRISPPDSAIRFVASSSLPAGEPYESFIHRTGCVPTRNNFHDLFNGLMWQRYPATKRRLNQLQAQYIDEHGVSTTRGALRDALTLFDENAALLCAPALLIDALRTQNWQTLFIERRALWSHVRIALFGHALLEKLVAPRKAITAHIWIVDDIDDANVAASLTVERLTSKPFLPLPVLGVPGWWSANEDPAFYDDPQVFRTARNRGSGG